MGKIVVSQFVTLDGVIEDPGGAEKFERGGWAFPFDRGDVGDAFKLDEVMASDALLLGRTTFAGFAEAWPSREGDFAGEIEKLRDAPGGDILVNGSAQLVSLLLDRGLIDELRLMVFRSCSARASACSPTASHPARCS
jgi:dihydrofolate reductase